MNAEGRNENETALSFLKESKTGWGLLLRTVHHFHVHHWTWRTSSDSSQDAFGLLMLGVFSGCYKAQQPGDSTRNCSDLLMSLTGRSLELKWHHRFPGVPKESLYWKPCPLTWTFFVCFSQRLITIYHQREPYCQSINCWGIDPWSNVASPQQGTQTVSGLIALL